MSHPKSRRVNRIGLLIFLVAAIAVSLRAQTQAPCTFKIFQLNDLQTAVFGVNHYASVVGEADFAATPSEKGFVRYSGGGVRYYSAPNSAISAASASRPNPTRLRRGVSDKISVGMAGRNMGSRAAQRFTSQALSISASACANPASE